MAKKRALLIGIDDYQPEFEKLRGCKQDVDRMAKLLTSYYGFEEVKELRDSDATKSAIRRSIEHLIEETSPEDIVLIHFSGHGTKWEMSEVRQKRKCEATIAYNDTSSPVHYLIVDDWWRAMLGKFKTNNVTIIFDCCHSGDMAKGFDPAIQSSHMIRYQEVRLSYDQIEEIEDDVETLVDRATYHQSESGGFVSLEKGHVMLAACKVEQTAKEYAKTNGLITNGVFTHFLCEILEMTGRTRHGRKIETWREAFQPLKRSIAVFVKRKELSSQEPTLQCKEDLRDQIGLFCDGLRCHVFRMVIIGGRLDRYEAFLDGVCIGVLEDDHWMSHEEIPIERYEYVKLVTTRKESVKTAQSALAIKAGVIQSLKLSITYRAVRSAEGKEHCRVEIFGSNDVAGVRKAVEALPVDLPPGYRIQTDESLSVVPPVSIGISCQTNEDGSFIGNIEKLANYLHWLTYPTMIFSMAKTDSIDSKYFQVFFHVNGERVSVTNSGKPLEIEDDVETFSVEWQNKHETAVYYVTLLEFDCNLAISQLHPLAAAGEYRPLSAGNPVCFERSGGLLKPSSAVTNQVTWRFIVTDQPVDFENVCQSGLNEADERGTANRMVVTECKPSPTAVLIADVQILGPEL